MTSVTDCQKDIFYSTNKQKGGGIMIFEDIKDVAKENTYFRKVIYTGKHSQLVLMSIEAGDDIGEETHETSDQIIFIVQGDGEAVLSDQHTQISKHAVVFVPAGTKHNIRNTGENAMKIYTVYAPSVHADGIIHQTKADAAKEYNA